MSRYPLSLFYKAIQEEDYFSVGSFRKPHGNSGAIVACFPDLDDTVLLKLPGLFVEMDHIKVPYRIRHMALTITRAVVQLEEISSRTEAYTLRNLPIFLPTALQTALLRPSVMPTLVDYEIIDRALGKLGKVESIYYMRGQCIMELSYQGKKLPIPYCQQFTLDVDNQQKKIDIQLPAGYLEAIL